MGKPIDCTGSAFADLKNPYSGERMMVKMIVREKGEPLFFAPDTYDTSTREPSARSLFDNWNRVDGVSGMRSGQKIVCAYTGEVLTKRQDGETHWFDGGFNPTRLHTRDDFLYFATMRNGVPTRERHPDRATKPDEKPPASLTHETEITDEAMKAAEELAKKHGDKLTGKKGHRK